MKLSIRDRLGLIMWLTFGLFMLALAVNLMRYDLLTGATATAFLGIVLVSGFLSVRREFHAPASQDADATSP